MSLPGSGLFGAIPDTSISGQRVARELTAIAARRSKPSSIVSDNGTEFTCNAMQASLKYRTPAAYAALFTATGQSAYKTPRL